MRPHKCLLNITLLASALSITINATASAFYTGHPTIQEVYDRTGGNADSLNRLVYSILQDGDFTNTLQYSLDLYEISLRSGNNSNLVYGAALAGMSYVHLRDRESALIYLKEAIAVGEADGLDWSLAPAYNGMGVYLLNFGNVDYYSALNMFTRGLEAARRSANTESYSVIIANIAYTYCLRNDPEGLPYALECYQLGLEKSDDYLIFIGSYVTASIYYLEKNSKQALHFIDIAADLISSESESGSISPYKAVMTYTMYGNIMFLSGRDAEAVSYYEKAIGLKDQLIGDQLVLTYLDYGNYHLCRGNYHRALGLFLEGLELSENMENQVYHNQFFRNISQTYEAIGQYREALRYHKHHYDLSMNLFNLGKERSLNEAKVQYELQSKEAEIETNKLLILQQRRKNQIYGLIIIIILMALAAVWYYYNKKNKFYREIVRQNQQAVRAREKLHHQRLRCEGELPSNKYANSPLSSERGTELFDKLERLMEHEKIYRDKDLNVDKLAEMLGSNRSYLSRTINEHSGLNFNTYVNKYRIDEAVQILSDHSNDIPLKALASDLGFNTLATFYNSFQRETGIPPSKYRKMLAELDVPPEGSSN